MSAPFSTVLDLRPEELALDGTGFALASLLLVLLFAVTPKTERRRIRFPALCFVAFVFVGAARYLLPYAHVHAGIFNEALRIIGVFSVLLAIARSFYLLVFHSRLAGRWFPAVPTIFRDILQVFLYLGVAMGALRAAGFELSSLLTTSAVITAVVGLSLQETLGNLFAGLALETEHPFDVGDWVQLDQDTSSIGQVIEMNWRATKVLRHDHVEVIVPNAMIARSSIRNFTKPTNIVRRSVRIPAALGAPPSQVVALVIETLASVPRVLRQPLPTVLVSEYQESRVLYEVRYFTDDFRLAMDTDGLVLERLWYAFARAGITIPLPQRQVELLEINEETRRDERARLVDKADKVLKFVNLFDALSAEEHRALAERSRFVHFSPGETIIREGERGSELYVIVSGTVSVFLGVSPSMEIATLGVQQFFGEMSLLTGEPRTASVRASSPCELLVVEHGPLKELLAGRLDVEERISRLLAERKLELDQRNSMETAVERGQRADQASRELLERIRAFFRV